MVDFSVVICTYNGASKIPQVLEHLLQQQKTSQFSWEVVVIDNNSDDETAAIVAQYQNQWPVNTPLRYCFEPRQGLAYARRCAIRNVTAPLVGFLDDDNLPYDTWVYEAREFGQQHPHAGAYGSEVQPIYDAAPPLGFERIAPLLAIINRGEHPFIYTSQRGVLPAGAGMVIRREVWLSNVPSRPHLAGVTSKSLRAKGEDVETLSYIRDAGWEVWHNPAMKIHHHIPVERMQRSYLLKLCRSVGLNRFPLRMVRYRVWQQPFVVPLYIASDLRRLVFFWMSYHQFLANYDLVRTCEFTLLFNSLISPLYHWYSSLVALLPQRRWALVEPKNSTGH